MVNALIFSNNIYFIQKLLNESSSQNLNIQFSQIVTNKLEMENTLERFHPNLIFVDEALGREHMRELLEKYREILIPLSYHASSHLLDRRSLQRLSALVSAYDLEKKKLRIVSELEYIGYNFKYKGTHYLSDTILHMYANRSNMVDNLQGDIYPILAKRYHKTVYNIKSSISKATDCMFCECDSNRLSTYFQFSGDVKPTVKQVVFTVISKI